MQDRQERRHRFPRRLRLKRRRLIRPLFDRTRTDVHTHAAGCLRALHRLAPTAEVSNGPAPMLQIGFAPGRAGGSAVTRTRIRRLMREAFRTQRLAFEKAVSAQGHARGEVLTVMLLFRGRPDDSGAIARDLPRLLKRIASFYVGDKGEGDRVKGKTPREH